MDKQIKIVLMAFIGALFPCLSFAMPDLYFYNNFLIGQSPFSFHGTDNNNIDFRERYRPYYKADVTSPSNDWTGFVTSFSSAMGGNAEKNALGFMNLDYSVGTYIEIPSNSAFVVSSMTGELQGFSCDSGLNTVLLGTTTATNLTGSATNMGYIQNVLMDGSSMMTFDMNQLVQSNYLSGEYDILTDSSVYYPLNVGFIYGTSFDTSNSSFIYMVYNTSDEVKTLWVDSIKPTNVNSFNDYVSLDNISFLFTSFSYSPNNNSLLDTTSYIFYLPHIKAEIDVYSPIFINQEYITNYNYNHLTYYNVYCSLDSDSINVFSDSYLSSFSTLYAGLLDDIVALENEGQYYIPYFIHYYNSSSSLFDKALWIKGGYISINNYDELISKLKEAGVGSSDMSEVVRILDEINSGGATGEEVKELIGILEEYHDQLMANGDFGSVTSVFDTYKNLLDFTDDMHWLITANNALFSYFAGFLMLCVLFLAINRVMR